MQAVGLGKAFDGCDLAPYDGAYALYAGPLRPAVDQNRARAALPFATAILGSGQVELIAEDAQKCGVGVGKMSIPIHVESNSGHATTSGGRICGVINDIPSAPPVQDWEYGFVPTSLSSLRSLVLMDRSGLCRFPRNSRSEERRVGKERGSRSQARRV